MVCRSGKINHAKNNQLNQNYKKGTKLMPNKTKKEFINSVQHILFKDYQNFKSDLRGLINANHLPDYYKVETLFEMVEEIREGN